MKRNIACSLLLAGAVATFSATDVYAAGDEAWANIGLGDLMNVKVESASRKQQAISDTPAAIFVITADDIRRAGALSLPEALRLAPGVEVARSANNKWAVSIRGFNGRMANKLLVMVDGRSIYSSLYGGVLWETEDVPMSEIERIEVVRGSAGVAWGSNAVNGAINIITRRAQDTHGWLVDSHVGTSTAKSGEVLRYGVKGDDGSALRVTLNNQKRDGGKELNGLNAQQDQWNDTSASFRYDKPDGVDRRWFASGKVYRFNEGESWLIPTLNTAQMYDPALYGATRLDRFKGSGNGVNLLGRLEQVTDGGGQVRVQAYVDQFKGTVPIVTDERNTLDIDAQHRFALGDSHDIVWGGNYRQNKHKETVSSIGFLTTATPDVTVRLSSLFLQDEWTLVPKTFNIQAGLRVEHQTYGGTSPQPSVKAMWTPSEKNSIWAGWSKAVRSPSIVDEIFGANVAVAPGAMPVLVHTNPGMQAGVGNEKVRTIELGYRGQLAPELSTDLVAYVSKYDGIQGISSAGMTANAIGNAITGLPYDPACAAALANYGLLGGPGLCSNSNFNNSMAVRTRGLEWSTDWRALSYWRLQLIASRMWLDGGALQQSYGIYGTSPKYQGGLRSSFDVTESQRFDLWWRRIGGMAGNTFSGSLPYMAAPIAARTELDLRYAVQAAKSLELSLTAQNLLSKQQLQFYADRMPTLPTVPQRAVFLQAVWRDM